MKIKSKILLGILVLSTLGFSAKLNYTTDKGIKYKGEIVKFAKEKQGSYPIFNMLYDGEAGMSTEHYWKDNLGINLKDVKVLRGTTENEKRFYNDNPHMLSMFEAFDVEMSGGYVKNHLDEVTAASVIVPNAIPKGILSLSMYYTTGSTGFMTSKSVYFGDTINELAGEVMQTPRFNGYTSDNTNLLVSAYGNDDTLKPQARIKGEDIYAIHPSQQSFFFPMFGEEVQKMQRSDIIKVKDFVCNGYKSNRTFTDIRNMDGPRQENPYKGCGVNDNPDKGYYPFFALYSRANTILADGEITAAGERRTGSSFAVPRLSAIITKIMQKFPGVSYLEAKEILLTSATREKDILDNQYGWGVANLLRALKGPGAINTGLIEEQKFYTGMYDKVFDFNGNAYFWASPTSDWTWSNDIYGNLPKHPSGSTKYDIVATTKDKDGDIPKTSLAFQTIRNVSFQNFIPSEKNYYADTAEFKPGLRKAGDKTLTINGNIYYEGPTQILEGTLVLNGNVPKSTVIVYENSTAVISGNVNHLIMAGGNVYLKEGAVIGTLEFDPNIPSYINIENEGKGITIGTIASKREKLDKFKSLFKNGSLKAEKEITKIDVEDVNVNPYKYQDLKREYFFSGFGDKIKKVKGDNIYPKLLKRYTEMDKAPESAKNIVPGYSNGNFMLDAYAPGDYDKEFTKLTNPIASNDNYKISPSSVEWSNFYDARQKAGLEN